MAMSPGPECATHRSEDDLRFHALKSYKFIIICPLEYCAQFCTAWALNGTEVLMCSLFDLLFEVLGVVGPEWYSDVRSQCGAQRVEGWPQWQMSFERLRPSCCYEKMLEKTLKGAILWVYDMSNIEDTLSTTF